MKIYTKYFGIFKKSCTFAFRKSQLSEHNKVYFNC